MHAFFVQKSSLCLEFGFERTFVRKTRAKNLDEIDDLGQFHQHFASSSYDNAHAPKITM